MRITSGMRDDLLGWRRFLSTFNGSCLWQNPFCSASALHLHTDAAGSCGYGAYWDGHWSADLCPTSWKDSGLTSNIVLLEIFPVLVALELWGVHNKNRRILQYSDN